MDINRFFFLLGEPPFGIVQPFPENIYPLEFTRANVTCIAFDATGTQEPKNITFYRRDDLNLYREVTGDEYLFSTKTEYVGEYIFVLQLMHLAPKKENNNLLIPNFTPKTGFLHFWAYCVISHNSEIPFEARVIYGE